MVLGWSRAKEGIPGLLQSDDRYPEAALFTVSPIAFKALRAITARAGKTDSYRSLNHRNDPDGLCAYYRGVTLEKVDDLIWRLRTLCLAVR